MPLMARKPTYIRAWRDEKGLTLEGLAGRMATIGVATTPATLSRIERGIHPYSQDMLEALAAALDVSVEQLIGHNPAIQTARIYDMWQHLTDKEAKQAEDVLHAMFGKRA